MRPDLSPQQLLILRAAAEGKVQKQIARDMRLSVSTVQLYTGQLFIKLQAQNMANAVAIGFRLGLLK